MVSSTPLKIGHCSDLLRKTVARQVAEALAEDEVDNDASAVAINKDSVSMARVISREYGILSGTFWFDETFAQIDPTIQIQWQLQDGDKLKKDTVLCTLRGNARNMIKGERCALNFLQTLSGTATITAEFVERVKKKIAIKDTRKTLPGLRLAQKYAVICGGGINHRMNLADAVLLKDNHIQACGSIKAAVEAVRRTSPEIEIEITSLAQIEEALTAKVDVIMLDNFSAAQIAKAVKIIAGKAKIEISGGINLDNISELATLSVDCISIGALTKHLRAIDFSMQFNQNQTD